MALGSLLGLIGGVAASAYAKSVANKKKETTTKQAAPSTTTVAPKNTVSSSVGNEHANYINQNSPGGLDAYIKLQNDRYNSALQNSGDSSSVDLLNRLQADAQRVGYQLNSVAQPVNPMLDMVNPYAAQLEQNQAQYNALLGDYKNVLNASVNKGAANLESQKGMINQNSDEMARQAYVLSRQNAKALPQQLASRGMTGGATETAQLGLQTNYENNFNNIQQNRSNALNAVDTAKTDLQNQGELSYAEQTLANNQAALNSYKSILDKSVNFDQWGADRNLSQNNYLNETASVNKQQEFNNILSRLEMGMISPNDAVALGVPPDTVQSYVTSLTAKKTTSSGGNSASSGSPSGVSDGVVQTAIKYLNQGNREKAIAALATVMSNAEIRSFLEQSGVRVDDIDWGVEEAEAPQESAIFTPDNMEPSRTLQMLISYFKSKGLSDEEIATRLNK